MLGGGLWLERMMYFESDSMNDIRYLKNMNILYFFIVFKFGFRSWFFQVTFLFLDAVLRPWTSKIKMWSLQRGVVLSKSCNFSQGAFL